VPTVRDAEYFRKAFNAVQDAIRAGRVAAGHDVGSGGLVTTLLEMTFAGTDLSADYDLTGLNERDSVKALFNENIAIVLQAKDDVALEELLAKAGIDAVKIGIVREGTDVTFKNHADSFAFNVAETRDGWYRTSFLLDEKQSKNGTARERFDNYKKQPLRFVFPKKFDGKRPSRALANGKTRPKAAVIREKGSNSEREMANALYLAGFDVKDVHMTDLITGRERVRPRDGRARSCTTKRPNGRWKGSSPARTRCPWASATDASCSWNWNSSIPNSPSTAKCCTTTPASTNRGSFRWKFRKTTR